MNYSNVGLLALLLNLIINREGFKKSWDKSEIKEPGVKEKVRYRYFLLAVTCYLIFDIAWGYLYDYHDIPSVYPFLYSDGVFYFIFMLVTMLTWIRYIVAYLDKRGRKTRALLYVGWSMFTAGLLLLMFNRFHPFIFSFNEKHEYVPESGRYILFLLHIALYMICAVYLLYNAYRSIGEERIKYSAAGLTSFVLGLFQILQILDSSTPFYAMGLVIGTCIIHSFIEEGEKREKRIYDNIASSLAEDYEAMYYINIETGEYREYAKSQEYDAMNVPMEGRDFYRETRENAARFAHPDDKEFAVSLYNKETMLANFEGRNSYSYKYRIMVGENPRYFRFTVTRANDEGYLVLYVKDIEDEMTAESMREERHRKHVTYSQIAESLASNYDEIYYVDVASAEYISYKTGDLYGKLQIAATGDDFYSETIKNIPLIVHRDDRDRIRDFIDRDNMISALERHKRYSIDYRVTINGRSQYFRMTVRKTSDGSHFIIGIENIDAEVRKEKRQLKALNTEKELARRDELTGIKNKTAYSELAQSVQADIDSGSECAPFAIVVCDANNLKKINDNEGHIAGDEYIRTSAKLLCDIFAHSPVFRVGGDEFAVFLRGSDHLMREALMEKLHDTVRRNQASGEGPIVASGMAEYDPGSDSFVSDVFDRADKEMYDNKQSLKQVAG